MKAFPIINYINAENAYKYAENGMDLRDYFAAKAMQSLIWNLGNESWLADVIPQTAYSWADKMMEARNATK